MGDALDVEFDRTVLVRDMCAHFVLRQIAEPYTFQKLSLDDMQWRHAELEHLDLHQLHDETAETHEAYLLADDILAAGNLNGTLSRRVVTQSHTDHERLVATWLPALLAAAT